MNKRKRKKWSARQSSKRGTVPGTPVFIGESRSEAVRIGSISYDRGDLVEKGALSLDDVHRPYRSEGVTWINVDGIHDLKVMDALGKRFGLHPLTIEDLMNTSQRPKAEVFPDYLFLVMKMMNYNDETNSVDVEHVSLILGEGYVLSFQEKEGDVFEPVRERLRASRGRLRGNGSDYLAYALMDAVVDHYFLSVERIGDVIEDMDDRLLIDPRPDDLQRIHELKRDVMTLRKAVWPLREAVGKLQKSDASFFGNDLDAFLRDLYDHTIQVIDMVESSRELLTGMHDTYLSSVSNRMNEVMKVLTVIATIFIPLTFIAGVYGMNFKYMPELDWRFSYPVVWIVMIAVGAGMVAYFRRKRWL